MILEQFAYITHSDGTKFQVLKLDENDEPTDWDEENTKLEYENYIQTGFFSRMWNKITT